jgi:aspartokinase
MESPRRASHWSVHKFGGSSVATSQRILNIPQIAYDELEKETKIFGSRGRILVVVSAMAGVTNELVECIGLAEKRNVSYQERIQAIHQVREVDRLLE